MILLTAAIILIVPMITVALLYSPWVKKLMERLLARPNDAQTQTDTADATTADGQQAAVKADEEFTALMARLQVTPSIISDQSGENDTTASFDFQGGHFIAILNQGASEPTVNSVSISFMNCYSLPAEHLSRAGELANVINNLMAPIKCAYILNPDLGEVDFSLHATDIYFRNDEVSAEHMRHLLLSFFRVQRMLFERFEQMKSDSPSDVESNRLIFGHQLYAISRLEITEQAEPWSEMLFQPLKLTLGEFLFRLFGLPPESDTILYING
ncbi:MAG: hypothetical protein K2M97_06305, partial [Muribaculaceae bacterium]|nr:hypothetical protein [Muribaculaceae bacterium]